MYLTKINWNMICTSPLILSTEMAKRNAKRQREYHELKKNQGDIKITQKRTKKTKTTKKTKELSKK